MEVDTICSGSNCDSDRGISPGAPLPPVAAGDGEDLRPAGTGNRRCASSTLSVTCKRAKKQNMSSPTASQSLHEEGMDNENEEDSEYAGEVTSNPVNILDLYEESDSVLASDIDLESEPEEVFEDLCAEPKEELIDLNGDDDADDEDEPEPAPALAPRPIRSDLNLNNKVHQRELEALTALDSYENLHKDETVGLKDFEILCVLGFGSYGSVYLVRKLMGTDMGALYAMKAIKKIKVLQKRQHAEHTKMERIVLQAVQRSRFLSQVHYAFQSLSKLYVVIDFIRGGDLFSHASEISDMGESAVRFYIAEMVLALEELHKLGIVYRDLKLENILLDADGHIVLADFGLATLLSEEKQYRTHSFCGTLEYMAPEVLRGEPTGYGMAVDWWSVGVLTYELLSKGKGPFESPADILDAAQIVERIRSDGEMVFSSVSPSGRDFVLCMLEINEKRRLGGNDREANKIKEHPWFNHINWQLLLAKTYPTPCKPPLSGEEDVQNFSVEFTDMPAVDEESEEIPDTIKVFRGYTYVAPQHLDEIRRAKQVHIEYCHPEVNEIPTRPDGFSLGPRIRRGSFSSCHITMAHYAHAQGRIVAKVVPLSKFRLSEVDALASCATKTNPSDHRCHPNILTYYKTIRDRTDVWILTEYIRGEELSERYRLRNLDEKTCRQIFRQIVLAVRHVHSKHFIHGDIKPENILFTDTNSQDLTIKLIDFGNACYNSSSKNWKDIPRYTLDYAAPELLADSRFVSYSPGVDIYGLGATLYTIVVGHPPYRQDEYDMNMGHERLDSLRKTIQAESFNKLSRRWKYASRPFRRLVVRCLNRDPAKRPNVDQILKSEWMRCCKYQLTQHSRNRSSKKKTNRWEESCRNHH
ncbi:chromosomal serine/threonine-protein kinase JIL-1-like [Drosophila obscura]|uniref:chromosomal serine/threonine-protein kinase JIL-1-like n=1 Tax=Drosophila obscura TaxID=7282 RepID=UPI001BB24095|nr:chromosomal serine/threonine-protein kinase JIL-1-like [Drosophila obscura]XP_022216070.2 chromosomal serine/threonine-protein kinase JIL-1-like [Drosophila obscura]